MPFVYIDLIPPGWRICMCTSLWRPPFTWSTWSSDTTQIASQSCWFVMTQRRRQRQGDEEKTCWVVDLCFFVVVVVVVFLLLSFFVGVVAVVVLVVFSLFFSSVFFLFLLLLWLFFLFFYRYYWTISSYFLPSELFRMCFEFCLFLKSNMFIVWDFDRSW